MQSTSKQTEGLNIFKKNPKGDILITGSGKFFREQKKRYSKYDEPYKQLYEDQIHEAVKNSSKEIRSLLSIL